MPLALLARAVALLPWSSLRRAGRAIGIIAGSILRIRRAHVEAAVRRAGFSDAGRVARAMYASLGTSVFEFLWIAGRPREPFSFVALTNRAKRELERFGAGDRGRVVATAHTGNWDLVACASAAAHVPLAVVTKKLHVRWLDRFWQGERAARGIRLLHGQGAFRNASHALERGFSVAMLIDQAPEKGSAFVRASFLGETANCDLAPAVLAARARVPLVLALGFRNLDGTHAIDIPLVLDPPPRPSRAWIEDATRQLNGALEAFIREHPSQWLWLHRRWKGVPPRQPRELAEPLALC
jgi:KDO2-lipid IV(A) lauroyltransferase